MHGFDNQRKKCIEETTELNLALIHNESGKTNDSDVSFESADVIFTAVQMAMKKGEHEAVERLVDICRETGELYERSVQNG